MATKTFQEIYPVTNEDGSISYVTVDVNYGEFNGSVHRAYVGTDGNDSVIARGYFSTLDGQAGDDHLTVSASYVTVDGSNGNDYIFVDTSGTSEDMAGLVLYGGEGRDTFAFAPGDHTINAKIKDFNPDEDTVVLVSLNSDLAVLASPDDGGIAVNENDMGVAEANARRLSQASTVSAIDGFDYNSDTKVANLVMSQLGLVLDFDGVENETALEKLTALNITIVDSNGASLGSRPAQPVLSNGLSIYHSDDYNEDWLYVYSDYVGDIWLGGVDWRGNSGLGWSDTTIADIRDDEDTVGGRMLAGNDGSNYIYAGSGGVSMWGGTGGSDYLYGGSGNDTFIAATSANESYTNMRNVGDNDIVYLGALRSTDIFPSTVSSDDAQQQVTQLPSIYLEGYSSGSGYNAQYNWRIWTYSSFLSIRDASYGTSVYVNRDTNSWTTTLQFADGVRLRYNYLASDWYTNNEGVWTPLALETGAMRIYTNVEGRQVVSLGSAYQGSMWLTDYFSSTQIIDASRQTVGNNMLVGNELDNSIVAGSGGASIWGGAGNDTLVGGNGADTFFAGIDGGNDTIIDVSSDDLIYLWNVNASDMSGLRTNTASNGYQRGINMTMNDGTSIAVYRAEGASTTTVQFADYSQWQYTYDGDWTQAVEAPPDGIRRVANNITVTSDYAGDLYLGGVDWNGNTVSSWVDDAVSNIYAQQDTVEGRALAGNAGSNDIYAGVGGASLWGGTGGYDYLYGGSGADTFIAGKGEGNSNIHRVGDEDVVFLHNINIDDIASGSFYESSSSNQIRLTTNDGTNIYIWYNTDTTVTTLRYANGETRTFDHVNGSWRDLFADIDTSIPNGLSKIGDALYVTPKYRGDIWLAGIDTAHNIVSSGYSDTSVASIDASEDTVGGRMLGGNYINNTIRAGSGGASLWGGPGGNVNYLYGGAGSDTFIIATVDGARTTWINEVDESDVVYFADVSSQEIFTANTDTRVHVEGISDGYSWQSAWYVWTYDNFLFFGDQSYNIDYYINPLSGSNYTTFQFSDGYQLRYSFIDANWYALDTDDIWKPYALFTGTLSEYTTEGGRRGLAVYSGYNGNINLNSGGYFNAIRDIDATSDTIGGRILVGNELDNSIVAGSGGASIFGGEGDDTLVGGNGVDTFDVREGDDSITILNCADDDLVILEDTYLDDITASVSGSTIHLTMSDGTVVNISGTDDATGAKIRFADYSQRRFNYAEDSWSIVVPAMPDGLTRNDDDITLTSAFEGDLWLSGYDIEGNTVDGWADNSAKDVDARRDTVENRMIAGNANDNIIRAGSGGASMWGGLGGRDYLYGGAGADTYVVATGANESTTSVYNFGENDIVYLGGISSSNINSLNTGNSVYIQGITGTGSSGYGSAWRFSTYSNYISIYNNAFDTSVYIHQQNGFNTMTFQFNDGYRLQYDYSDAKWYFYEDENWKPYAIEAGTLSEYTTDGGRKGLAVSSDYSGTLNLDGSDYFNTISDIDATADTMSSRILLGNALDNSIAAGSGGVSMNGGAGDDTLVGGDGVDTFTVTEGNTTILQCSSDDIVLIGGTTYESLLDTRALNDADGNAIGVELTTEGGSVVSIRRTDNASITNVLFEDLARWQYSYTDQSWTQTRESLPAGLESDGANITVTSNYAGDLYLGGVDLNGETVDGWADGSIISIDARNDTVAGRMLAGNSQSNVIRAGSSGTSLWGGNGGNDALYGGAGADTFIAGEDEGNTTVWYCADNDVVVLHNIDINDIASANLYDGSYSYRRIELTTSGGTRIYVWYDTDTSSSTTIQYADGERRSFDHNNGSWTDLFVGTDGLIVMSSSVVVTSSFVGNLSISDTTLITIDASNDTVGGRLLEGNELGNYIYAGSGGASLYGGEGGVDYLYGADGADTFIAGQGEGDVDIYHCNNEDVVLLHNIMPSDITAATLSTGAHYLSLMTTDNTYIMIAFDTGTTLTTIQYADGSTRTWDHNNDNWQDLFVVEAAEGLTRFGTTAFVAPSFVGNIVLGGVDWNGDSIEGWSDTSIVSVNASDDTVSGRLFAGNSLANTIRAGSGGASLYGGIDSGDNWNYLYGGAGADTYVMGMGSGKDAARDVGDEDIVVLYNVNREDIADAYLLERDEDNFGIIIIPTDDSYINIWYHSDTTLTTVEYANGNRRVFDHVNGNWFDIFADTSTGLATLGGSVYVPSSYVGNISLSDTTLTTIDASYDTVGGRVLIGNELANTIRAGSGGASMYGGEGGDDYLIGGEGADTFVAGMGDGGTSIWDVGDNDLIVLHNINFEDIADVNANDYSIGTYLYLTTTDLTDINIWYRSDTTLTTIQFADGETRTFDHVNGDWRDLFTLEAADGLTKLGSTLSVESNYTGDVVLSGTDWSGTIVAGYSDTSIIELNASDDTVSGRPLAGNNNSNTIIAGSGGAIMYGGDGSGDDWNYIYGGAGADTFVAGMGGGKTAFYNVNDDDSVVLHNIDLADISYAYILNYDTERDIVLIPADNSYINIFYTTDTTLTSIELADGEHRSFDHVNGSWLDLFADTSTGLVNFGSSVLLTPSFVGDIALGGVDWNGDSIDGYSNASLTTIDAQADTVDGRLLAGNMLNNMIWAGNGGASMWGGPGGANILIGGAGADTFLAGRGFDNSIWNVGNDDIVVLYDFNADDITYATLGIGENTNYVLFGDDDGTEVLIEYATDTTLTSIRYADGETRSFDHANGNWFDLIIGSSGVFTMDSTVYITSAFVGDVVLGGVDQNGSTVDGYSNDTLLTVDANGDTVSGRLLAGNDLNNPIIAGVGGASMWGGVDGNDYLTGGAGADTFIAGMNEGNVHVQDVGDDDIVMLHDINIDDLISVTLDDDCVRLTLNDSLNNYIYIEPVSDASLTSIQFADGTTRTWDHSDGSWFDLFMGEEPLPDGLSIIDNAVSVSADYDHDIALGGVDWTSATVDSWTNNFVGYVSALSNTVSGHLLAGNAQSNNIIAGSGGSTLWGGHGGYDYLYGGDGADTFVAGKGDGNTRINNCGDDDIVYLYNINPAEIRNASLTTISWSNSDYIMLNAIDGTYIYIYYNTETSTSTTIRYANGDTRTWDHADGDWRELFVDNDTTLPAGLSKFFSTVYVSSDYVGDIWLGGVDLDGDSVDGWTNTLIGGIDATGDTVSGRMLAGDSNQNTIIAGSGGASLWGGHGSLDFLYGGDGVDTFIAGNGDGNTSIFNCGDDDVVYLYNIEPDDVSEISKRTSGDWDEFIRITTNDDTYIFIRYDTDTVSTTTVVYADGTRTQYDHVDEEWSTLQSSAALDDLWGGGDAVDDLIRADVDDDPLASVLNVAGNVALNELNPLSTAVELDGNSLIMKYAADLRRRSNR
ncbi:MAG: hypothetical protein IJU71_03325 [Selenomonadaceae bacterium]|nr:hypothetical protein [Selenomonadaceae bacterium]